jgi:hypothetical protein
MFDPERFRVTRSNQLVIEGISVLAVQTGACGSRGVPRSVCVIHVDCGTFHYTGKPFPRSKALFLIASGVFRIDHDEKFNQTTHLQYQPWKRGPWVAFNWRYDNGLVAGAVPCFAPTDVRIFRRTQQHDFADE